LTRETRDDSSGVVGGKISDREGRRKKKKKKRRRGEEEEGEEDRSKRKRCWKEPHTPLPLPTGWHRRLGTA
jgi:hypothetical protein